MTRNLTIGPPTRLIMVFAIPLVVGNVFQQLYQFTDAIVVGRLISVHALAAVGASGSILFFLTGLSIGSSVGVPIPVARAFGAGRLPVMRRAVAAGAMITVGIAAFITIVGALIAGPLLRLLDTPAELVPDATTFLRVSFLGVGAIAAFNYLSSLIRAR
ncbi:hypothetical protein GCM10011575_35920 [Microlunatus endophyticus]|uniref:Probable multidrug resistance protein NorM n=1 Tax=Microlunatus endophyticus TaxID=1716077 RepID=A0A917SDI0_9ACTN|nr:MATE family efflux transporter [Microlunatus endophyticus]GGL74510.1 hypothetical protein GCM10011575_35920 [Microlunatus endophyticus]